MDKNYKVLEQTAARLDNIINLKGLLEWFDGMALKAILVASYESANKWEEAIGNEFIQLCQAFNEVSYENMIDEGADLVAEIVKKIVIVNMYNKFKR